MAESKYEESRSEIECVTAQRKLSDIHVAHRVLDQCVMHINVLSTSSAQMNVVI